MLRFRNYWIYSAGLAIAWAVVLNFPLLFAETDKRCARNTKFLHVLRSLDLATISFPGCTSISFVDG
jgi:hypothetical protein